MVSSLMVLKNLKKWGKIQNGTFHSVTPEEAVTGLLDNLGGRVGGALLLTALAATNLHLQNLNGGIAV